MTVKSYCEKYGVSRSQVMNALYRGYLHAQRDSKSWWIEDEPINREANLQFHVMYISCFCPVEYQELEVCSDYDEALSDCRRDNWTFETCAHGHDRWKSAIEIHIE